MDRLSHVEGFDWDEGTIEKNWEKHHVSYVECEEVFLSRPLLVAEDERHSKDEARDYALGKTREGRNSRDLGTRRRSLSSGRAMIRRNTSTIPKPRASSLKI